MNIEQAFEQLEALRQHEVTLANLAGTRDELEVEVIVAGTDTSSKEASERVAVGESRAARIVDIIDRRETIARQLGWGEHNVKHSTDALSGLQAAATALDDWLTPVEKPRPSLLKQLSPLLMLVAVGVTLYCWYRCRRQ